MLRLDLPSVSKDSTRRRIAVAFDKRADWYKTFSLGMPRMRARSGEENDDKGRGGSVAEASRAPGHPVSGHKTSSISQLLERIMNDVDSVDDTNSDSDSDSDEESISDEDELLQLMTELDVNNFGSLEKAETYLGPPRRNRRGQIKQVVDWLKGFSARWLQLGRPFTNDKRKEREKRRRPDSDDDHIPLSEMSHDELSQVALHRKVTQQILEGTIESERTRFEVTGFMLKMAFERREHEAYQLAKLIPTIEQERDVKDPNYIGEYMFMRMFYAREDELIAERAIRVRLRQERRARAEARAAAKARGWTLLFEELAASLRRRDADRIRHVDPDSRAYLLLMDRNDPEVVEYSFCFDGLNRRQMQHLYCFIQEREFRDVVWLSDGSEKCPCKIKNDDSMAVIKPIIRKAGSVLPS